MSTAATAPVCEGVACRSLLLSRRSRHHRRSREVRVLASINDGETISRKVPSTSKSIAIVGGGFAGVGCMHELITSGVDLHVTLFDAGQKLGGRACGLETLVQGGMAWDTGCQYFSPTTVEFEVS